MTERKIAEIMHDPELARFLFKCARRYSALIEDQEEYVQEGYLRIAKVCEDNTPRVLLHDEGRRAVFQAYQNKLRRVCKIRTGKANSIYKDTRKTVDLGRGRYLLRKPQKLDPWFYRDEPGELGLDYNDFVAFYFYQIMIEH